MSRLCTPIGPKAPFPYGLAKVWKPALFQDGRKRLGYFEGWYYKCVDLAGQSPVAVIPGVALDLTGDTSHSFVQLIRSDASTAYWEYPAGDFRFSTTDFEIQVGPNRFTDHRLVLALEGESGSVAGELSFSPWSPWPVRPLSPGIMGWYRFVPFMETYHGVLSLDHEITGSLEMDGSTVSFDGGRGYVEKDWGRSFPSAWVWAQSNHFDSPGTSVTVSVARIPWLSGSFVGYIVGLLHEGELYEFTTYNGAKMEAFSLEDGTASMTLRRRGIHLSLTIEGAEPGKLRSPVLGEMDGVTWESLGASISVNLREGTETLFQGIGRSGGAEFMDAKGDLESGLAGGNRSAGP